LLVRRFLQIEKGFKIVKLLSFFFNLTSFIIELTDYSVSIVNDVRRGFFDVVRAVRLELNSEFINSFSEVTKLLLDISSFLVLKWKNGFLDWSKCFLTDFNEVSLRVF
jgi:hypothetical protein